MSGQAYVGTSGWSYDSWRDSFYAGVRRKDWLQHYAACFAAVEVNGTFYRQPPRATFAAWAAATPGEFRFAIKSHRFLTHTKRLQFPLDALQRQREAAAGLGGKLRVVVWQLPANLEADLPRLERFARALNHWRRARHAVEFRHASWFNAATAACLHEHQIAVCQSNAADWPMWNAVTTDLVHVRLHGHAQTYVSGYAKRTLALWARRARRWLAEGREVHIYFDNTDAGHAYQDAARLRCMLERAD